MGTLSELNQCLYITVVEEIAQKMAKDKNKTELWAWQWYLDIVWMKGLFLDYVFRLIVKVISDLKPG